jgi:hypothetical protein
MTSRSFSAAHNAGERSFACVFLARFPRPAQAVRSIARAGFAMLLGASVLGAGLSGLGAIGCSSPPRPTTANVKASDLPPSADWSGVFYSPLYGHLHLVKEGNSVSGKWRTTGGDKWGELHGEVTGDLLKYKWVEHKIGMVGPGSSTEGRGYFKYYVPAEENANHEIKGEWGLERSEVGNSWEAVRQRNMLPDLGSVRPDETERVNMPDEWDSSGNPPSSSPNGEKPAAGEPGSTSDEDM